MLFCSLFCNFFYGSCVRSVKGSIITTVNLVVFLTANSLFILTANNLMSSQQTTGFSHTKRKMMISLPNNLMFSLLAAWLSSIQLFTHMITIIGWGLLHKHFHLHIVNLIVFQANTLFVFHATDFVVLSANGSVFLTSNSLIVPTANSLTGTF